MPFYICKMERYIIWFTLAYHYLVVNCNLRTFNVVHTKLTWENKTAAGNSIIDISIKKLLTVTSATPNVNIAQVNYNICFNNKKKKDGLLKTFMQT